VSVNHFKGEVWSKVLLGSLPMKTVFAGPMVVNREYEGEIAEGNDTVHITSLNDPTVSDYFVDQDLTYEDVQDAGLSFTVDQAKYWAVRINDVDKAQAAGQIAPWMEGRAAYKVGVAADQFLASKYTSVAAANVLGSSGSPLTPAVFGSFTTNPADFLVKVIIPLQVKLDESDVPDDGGRYIIVPPWGRGLVAQTAGFVLGTAADGSTGQVMQKGFFGSLAGFNFMTSRNTVQTVAGGAGTGVWAIQAGHSMAITYAEQIIKTEALRSEKGFRDLVRGLHVYGAKVIHPEALAVAYVQRPVGI
jgi:hypothetical protein